MTLATHARAGYHGIVDPTTATCSQHVVASPHEPGQAGGYCLPTDLPSGTECVVCDIPGADLIGKPVITWWDDADRTTVYGGPGKGDGWTALSFSLRDGGPPVRYCAATEVAPYDTPIPLKDERVVIEKLPKKRDYQDAGPWLLHLPGIDGTTKRGFRTKSEAVQTGLRRLAILDYQASVTT